MKRLSSSDSLGAFMSICPNSTVVDQHSHGSNPLYTRDFQTMLEGLDEDGCVEESCQISEKKRRLGVDQVKALEKNFEVDNKLEPERKVKLAQELGLQPRQVAVWFQNRRARWKTKQLERDYGVLKASHDALKHKYESLQRENESLQNEIRELKSQLNGIDGEIPVKEEASLSLSDTEEKRDLEYHDAVEQNLNKCDVRENEGAAILKDGSSDSSNSSAILNDDNNSPVISSSGAGSTNPTANSNPVKIEEHDFLGEECCSSLFSDDQAPTLHWYGNDDWS